MYHMNVKKTKIISCMSDFNNIRLFHNDIEYVSDAYSKISINAIAIVDLMCILYQCKLPEDQVQAYVDNIKKNIDFDLNVYDNFENEYIYIDMKVIKLEE